MRADAIREEAVTEVSLRRRIHQCVLPQLRAKSELTISRREPGCVHELPVHSCIGWGRLLYPRCWIDDSLKGTRTYTQSIGDTGIDETEGVSQ